MRGRATPASCAVARRLPDSPMRDARSAGGRSWPSVAPA